MISVAAAGGSFDYWNSEPGVVYPAASPHVISVGGTWDANEGANLEWRESAGTAPDQIGAYSNRHETMLDIFAPGGLIDAPTPSPSGETDPDFGTSFATPFVTAAIALAQHMKQELQGGGLMTRTELEALFKSTGKQIFDGDEDMDGIVDPGDEEIAYTTPTGDYYKRLDIEAMAHKLFTPASAPDLVFPSDWGFDETDEITGDTTPTFSGTAPLGSHVWLYVDGVEKANGPVDGSGYTLTSSALAVGNNQNVTIRVAADSAVAPANRSQPSSPLLISIVQTDTSSPVASLFPVRMSETLVITGTSSGTSALRIDWGTSPKPARALTKSGTGAVTITGATDPGVPVTYNNQEGKTEFNANTGSTSTPNWDVYVATSSNVDFNGTQNLNDLTVASDATATVNSGTLVVRTYALGDADDMLVLGSAGSSIVHDSNGTNVSVSVNIGGSTITGTATGLVTLVRDLSDSTPALRKFGSGTFKITGVSDKTVAVNFVNEEGKTEFHTNVGNTAIANSVNWSVRVHEMPGWAASSVEFQVSQNLMALGIDAGAVVTLAASTAPNFKTLTVASLAIAESSTLDLTNNGFIIDYAATLTPAEQDFLAAQIRAWIISGRGGSGIGEGTWDGWGITSSTAAAMNSTDPESRSVGYGVNLSMPLGSYTTFMGQTVDTSALFFRYTIMADLDLNGTVSADDATVQTAFYGTTSTGDWITGDLDYDGDVDDDDVALLNSFYGQSI